MENKKVDCYSFIASELVNIGYEVFYDKCLKSESPIYDSFRSDVKMAIMDIFYDRETDAMCINLIREKFPDLITFITEHEATDEETLTSYLCDEIEDFFMTRGSLNWHESMLLDSLREANRRIESYREVLDDVIHKTSFRTTR